MIVKTLLTSLFVAILFSSCDPNADKQVGNANRFNSANSGSSGSSSGGSTGGGGTTGSTGTPTDAPIDGGLGILLLAGTAYGIKRVKGVRQQKNKRDHLS